MPVKGLQMSYGFRGVILHLFRNRFAVNLEIKNLLSQWRIVRPFAIFYLLWSYIHLIVVFPSRQTARQQLDQQPDCPKDS